MNAMVNPGWSRPSNLLFATEIPVNERAFAFALEQALEFGAHLILFHTYDTLVVAAAETSGIRYSDYPVAAETEIAALEPFAQRVRAAGIECTVIVRPGLPADQLLAFMHERTVDRVVMGTHARGLLGQLLIGSVAESIVRTAHVPVCVIGPEVVNGNFRNFATRTVLCAVYEAERSGAMVAFAAEVAREHKARLILQHVISQQDRLTTQAARAAASSVEQWEERLHSLVPPHIKTVVPIETVVVWGEAADELLYQSKAQQVDLIVMGTTQRSSMLAAGLRPGVLHNVMAQAQCPVLTVSSWVAEEASVRREQHHNVAQVFMAGIF